MKSFLILFSIPTLVWSQALRVLEFSLVYNAGNKIIIVKEFQECNEFRGYGMIDSTRVFLAYQPEHEAEASTVIAVFDLTTQKETIIDDIGGTGECTFEYNSRNHLVLYNDFDGINVFPLATVGKPQPRRVCKIQNSFLPFWVGDKTIGYRVAEADKWITKYVEIQVN